MFLVIPGLVTVFTVGFLYRESGIPFVNYNLWSTLIVDDIPVIHIPLVENLVIWMILYVSSYAVLYVEPFSIYFHQYKLNKAYPSKALVFRELWRSLRGILIGSSLEVLMNVLYRTGNFPTFQLQALRIHSVNGESVLPLLLATLVAITWGDGYFYVTHRWLHTKWLYQNVHKVHHESVNPTPYSGLSMHWFESIIYFMSGPIIGCLLAPPWLFRLICKGLIIFPLEGHAGFGAWGIEASHNHYLHHSKFNWNFGSSPLWDYTFGTNYKYGKAAQA